MKLILSLLLSLLAVCSPAFAQMSPAERAMVQAVEKEGERNIALLERLVNQNSGTLKLS